MNTFKFTVVLFSLLVIVFNSIQIDAKKQTKQSKVQQDHQESLSSKLNVTNNDEEPIDSCSVNECPISNDEKLEFRSKREIIVEDNVFVVGKQNNDQTEELKQREADKIGKDSIKSKDNDLRNNVKKSHNNKQKSVEKEDQMIEKPSKKSKKNKSDKHKLENDDSMLEEKQSSKIKDNDENKENKESLKDENVKKQKSEKKNEKSKKKHSEKTKKSKKSKKSKRKNGKKRKSG